MLPRHTSLHIFPLGCVADHSDVFSDIQQVVNGRRLF